MTRLLQPKARLMLIVVACAVLFTISCKKDDPETNNTITPPEAFLKSQTIKWTIGGHHDGPHDSDPFVNTESTQFAYDNQKRLVQENDIHFIYNVDGKLSKTIKGFDTIFYQYTNGTLSSIITAYGYYDGGRFIDTTTFHYKSGVLDYCESVYDKSITVFKFTTDNKVASKFITYKEAGTVRSDSLFYTWEKGNLVKLRTKSAYPLNSDFYQREYRYDDKPSFNSAIHYPDEYLFVREITQFYSQNALIYYQVMPWRFNCKNNPVEFTEKTTDQTKTTPYSIGYNANNYPVLIYGMEFEMRFEY